MFGTLGLPQLIIIFLAVTIVAMYFRRRNE
jgi:hypothetical protein